MSRGDHPQRQAPLPTTRNEHVRRPCYSWDEQLRVRGTLGDLSVDLGWESWTSPP